MPSRQLHLGAFMRPASIHTGAWRYPGAWADMNFNFAHIRESIQKLEAAKFDAFFMADHMAVLNMPMDALKRSHTATSFEPFTLLSALSQVTERIGLIATGSTTFDAPYHIARRFASLDHLSNGRAGWNIVTTSNPDAALNFGLDDHMEHGERYRRAREFYDVVTGLWDSWADDAFIRDVDEGIFFDPAKMHVLNHKGKYLSVRGPLNIARSIQGWPVIVQAGASEAGRQLAAETAEAVFTAQSDIAAGRQFYADVKGRMLKLGRAPELMKILPGFFKSARHVTRPLFLLVFLVSLATRVPRVSHWLFLFWAKSHSGQVAADWPRWCSAQLPAMSYDRTTLQSGVRCVQHRRVVCSRWSASRGIRNPWASQPRCTTRETDLRN
jgi:FMN-dependent oxidoreductase (nitrilotriacetate monooxygenase family)